VSDGTQYDRVACCMPVDMVGALDHPLSVSKALLPDIARFLPLSSRLWSHLRAEDLFLRRQPAFYAERKEGREESRMTPLTMHLLSRFCAWKDALVIVRSETVVGWHRKVFCLFWRWKNKGRGRPRLPMELQRLTVQMAERNVIWGEERIIAELLRRLGVRVSPRSVRPYIPQSTGAEDRPCSFRESCTISTGRNPLRADTRKVLKPG